MRSCRYANRKPGHLDTQIVRPIAGLTATYTVIIRFDEKRHLKRWLASDLRRKLIRKVKPLLAQGDRYVIHSGIDFLFNTDAPHIGAPVRWKQFLLTWSVIYPLVLGVPLLVMPVMKNAGLPNNHYLQVLVTTCLIVSLMVYAIMPRYAQLVRKWLFR